MGHVYAGMILFDFYHATVFHYNMETFCKESYLEDVLKENIMERTGLDHAL